VAAAAGDDCAYTSRGNAVATAANAITIANLVPFISSTFLDT
jgi:hypothetical protein